jgi:hypothetical protein
MSCYVHTKCVCSPLTSPKRNGNLLLPVDGASVTGLASSDRSAVFCRLINLDLYQQYKLTILLACSCTCIASLKQAARIVIELCVLLGQLEAIRAYHMTEMHAHFEALEHGSEFDMYLQSPRRCELPGTTSTAILHPVFPLATPKKHFAGSNRANHIAATQSTVSSSAR